MKKCTKCGEISDNFNKEKANKDSLQKWCVDCQKGYFRTIEGLIKKIYYTQVVSSRKRKMDAPNYMYETLLVHLLVKKEFHILYNDWVDSGYKKDKRPSCDRIDDYKPYTLRNIQLMTWGDNAKKSWADKINGINNKQNKAVIQFDLDGNFIKEYYSTRQAQRETKITHISDVARGVRKTASGYIWKYKQ